MMVGVNDRAVLSELARSKFPGLLPLREENDHHPVCFDRVLANLCNINGSNKKRLLYSHRRKLEAQRLINMFTPVEGDFKGIDVVVLTSEGWGVVDGKK